MCVADLRCTAILSASDKGKIEIKKNKVNKSKIKTTSPVILSFL